MHVVISSRWELAPAAMAISLSLTSSCGPAGSRKGKHHTCTDAQLHTPSSTSSLSLVTHASSAAGKAYLLTTQRPLCSPLASPASSPPYKISGRRRPPHHRTLATSHQPHSLASFQHQLLSCSSSSCFVTRTMPAMAEEEVRVAPEPHFLVVTFPAMGHINPARHLARRLLRATGARVTVSTAVSALRKMFPGAEAGAEGHRDAAGVRYVPYSDGYDDGFDRTVHDNVHYMSSVKLEGSRTLAEVLLRLRDAGRPVTLVVYTLLMSWVADVARDHGVPAALYWIQPATVLAAYLHYFRGTGGVDKAIAAAGGDPWADVRFPGLPPLRIRDLPSFIVSTSENDPYAFVSDAFRELVEMLGRGDSPCVLANTFDALEPEAVVTLREHGVDVVPVGPVLSFLDDAAAAGGAAKNGSNDLFTQDHGYLDWLDAQAPGSVVYISFGSLSVMSTRQIEEVARGMADSGRPFLWVLREDNRGGSEDAASLGGERGMVVGWCDQVRVLSHPAVGCFVTHCGWNSTLESMACGVPVVGVPQWTDQGTNAWLVERAGTGVRAAVSDKDGVLEADELRRCLDFATSEMVRAKAAMWREKARAAASGGGSSERNLKAFVAKQIAGGN